MIKRKGLYYPQAAFQKRAWVKDKKIYKEANKDPILFWEKRARELFWLEPWQKAFEHNPPYFKWFVGGKTNITSNIFEHNKLGWAKIKNKTALIWEPEPVAAPKGRGGQVNKYTYDELFTKVNKFANALKKLGVKKGDKVGIYLPMVPEVVVSMLACARIGAVHSVVFSAFSPHSLQVRLQDTEAKVLITADGYWRRGQIVELKKSADEGVKATKVEKVIVVKRAGNSVPWDNARDLWFHEIVKGESEHCEPAKMDAEDTFFILYTSGSTGKPKGVVHTCAGYMAQAYWTGKWIFDFKAGDVFWCTADVGWVTGHTYTTYSPLLNGITTLMFEGAPDWPEPDRWAQIIEKHKVSIFYTAPTAIRMFEKYGAQVIKKYKFKTLRLLGSVGEPIDESSWLWFFEKVGKKKCPIVDTWWQTETGGILITSLPGIGPFKPAFAGIPFPGVQAEIRDGNLLILPPFTPGMLRGIYKNPQKYEETYWSNYGKEIYFTSDGAAQDKNGLIRIVGRVDDVLKVAGHRLTTGEMEEAINAHPKITESAVIGVPDEIKGETPLAFVVPREKSEGLDKEVLSQIRKEIGPIAQPKAVYIVEDLPKTRSGKIMRRILKKVIAGQDLGDLSTLANPESVDKIKQVLQKGLALSPSKGQKGFIVFLLNVIFIAVGILAIIIGLLWNTGVLEQIPGIFQR